MKELLCAGEVDIEELCVITELLACVHVGNDNDVLIMGHDMS